MELLDIKLIHQGEYLCYYEASYCLPDGKTKIYEFVSRHGNRHDGSKVLTKDSFGKEFKAAAVIMFVLSEDYDHALISREFRLGVNGWVYNNPAGLIDPGETADEAIARELKEEMGLDLIDILYHMPVAYSMPGLSDDTSEFVICRAKGPFTPSTSPAEQIECFWASKEEVKALLNDPNSRFSGRTQAVLALWADM